MRQMFLLLLFCATFMSAQEIKTIAVNDLDGQNLDSATVLILSNRVRSELIRSNAYTVVERGEMAAILQEQGFQASGACSESSCLVEIGQLLGVQLMIAGTVGKLNDNFYTVSLRMIDVGSGKIVNSASHDHAGSLERLLSEGLTAAVGKLIQSSGADSRVMFTGLTGDLYIESSVSGAAITIDGNETGKVTPFMFEAYPAGVHQIMLKSGDFEGSQTVTIQAKELLKVNVSLKKILSTVMIKSNPSGADIFNGKQLIGKTPLKIDTLPTGTYTFRLTSPNCKPVLHTIDLENGKSSTIDLTLPPCAIFELNIIPDTVTVMLNGVLTAKKTPLKIDTLSTGENKLTITHPNYADTTILFTAVQGEVISKKVMLRFSDAYLKKRAKSKQWTRRVLFGMFGTGLTFAGYSFDKKLDEANSAYLSESGYDQAKHDGNYKEAQKYATLRNIMYGTAGAFGLGFVLSIPF